MESMQCVEICGHLKGLPAVYSCFSQDAAHLTQITAQGHENKDPSFPPEMSFLLWDMSTRTEERLMEHGEDGIKM